MHADLTAGWLANCWFVYGVRVRVQSIQGGAVVLQVPTPFGAPWLLPRTLRFRLLPSSVVARHQVPTAAHALPSRIVPAGASVTGNLGAPAIRTRENPSFLRLLRQPSRRVHPTCNHPSATSPAHPDQPPSDSQFQFYAARRYIHSINTSRHCHVP